MIDKRDPGVSPAVWQEQDGWHVRVRQAGAVRVFATRDEAISYSTSTFTDGPSAARAETQRGDVTPSAPPVAEKTTPRAAARAMASAPKRPSESGSDSGL